MARILVVEDEPGIAMALEDDLRLEGYAVEVIHDGLAAAKRAREASFDAILLDVMLPGKDGFAVCRRLRARDIKTPVLMLTARDAIDDRVEGLDSGADDYLVKPFEFKELLARVRALLRRAGELRPSVLQVADLTLNTANHTAARSGKHIGLTAKEYALLEYFALHQGRLLGREEIAEHVWDENFDPMSNVIDVYVRRLRKKVDEGFGRPLIHTRRGSGYVLSAEGEGENVE
jgi:DNA-binding response OmpR family regulator